MEAISPNSPQLGAPVWYYAGPANETLGPVPLVELKRLAVEGIITRDTFVFRDGGKDWQPYSMAMLPPIPSSAVSIPARAEAQKENANVFRAAFSFFANRERKVPSIIALTFVYPVGLVLLWRNRAFKKAGKIILTCIFGIFFLVVLGSTGNGGSKQSSQSQADNDQRALAENPSLFSIDAGGIVHGQYYPNFYQVITAFYHGQLTLADIEECRFSPGVIKAQFENGTHEYLICNVPDTDALVGADEEMPTLEFAVRRNGDVEDDFAKHFPDSLNSGYTLLPLYFQYYGMRIVGVEEFTTATGMVKQIPVMEAYKPGSDKE